MVIKCLPLYLLVTQLITMEYAGKHVFSEARGKWKYTWNLPIFVINRYFKQIFFYCIETWKNIIVYAGKI